MSFRDYTFPDVQQKLGLTVAEADLFSQAAAVTLRAEFVDHVRYGADMALALNTEKARSEFIIAPVLVELRRSLADSFGLFSGIELNGICDFIITKSPRLLILTAPLMTIVEAKNDNLRNGFGQCISAMVAAQKFNEKSGTPIAAVYGAITTGSAWKFLVLKQSEVVFDLHEYSIVDLARIMGIFTHIIQGA